MSLATQTPLDRAVARTLAHRSLCRPSTGQRIGLELEWHVYDPDDLRRRLTPEDVRHVVTAGGPLAPGVTASVEPGGQIEIDTPPLSLPGAGRRAHRAAGEVRRRLRAAGLEPVAVGVDPHRAPQNLLDVPRYRAMAARFAARGPAGVVMMANTAAFQVNVDLDPDHDRWRLAHQLGPTLVAAFANSPVGTDGRTGWRSHRLATWWAIDPSRTRPVPHDGDPVEAWLTYALNAEVLLIRRADDASAVTEPMSFDQWLTHGHRLGPPTVDDFAYHLTTLFPPIRPRGYLELRFLDALDHPHWLVAAAVVAGVLDPGCLHRALVATEPAAGRWMEAARLGLDDPVLAPIAAEVAELALVGLARQSVDRSIIEAVRRWRDTELAAGLTPADAVLDRWRSTGTVLDHDAEDHT